GRANPAMGLLSPPIAAGWLCPTASRLCRSHPDLATAEGRFAWYRHPRQERAQLDYFKGYLCSGVCSSGLCINRHSAGDRSRGRRDNLSDYRCNQSERGANLEVSAVDSIHQVTPGPVETLADLRSSAKSVAKRSPSSGHAGVHFDHGFLSSIASQTFR